LKEIQLVLLDNNNAESSLGFNLWLGAGSYVDTSGTLAYFLGTATTSANRAVGQVNLADEHS
jgi:hypothetical protein